MPAAIAASIVTGALFGLHAAHEARDERGMPLGIVHRDVSPQNILVGTDGVARVLDFGVAKAAGRLQTTREGQLKGKIAYMPPEQIHGSVTRQTDVYAAAVVLWEALTGTKLFTGDSEGEVLNKILSYPVPPPSRIAKEVPGVFDSIVLRGLERDPAARYATAKEMARELEMSGLLVPLFMVGEWVEKNAADELSRRAALVGKGESTPISGASLAVARDGSGSFSLLPPRPSEPPTVIDAVDAVASDAEAHAVRTTSSVVSTADVPRGRVGARRVAGAVLLLGAVVTGVILVRGRMEQTTNPAAEVSAVPSPVPSVISITPSVTGVAPSTPPPSVSLASAVATSSSKAAPGPTALHPVSKWPAGVPTAGVGTSVAVSAKTAVTTVETPPQPNCDPPFEIVNGKERLKPQCRTP